MHSVLINPLPKLPPAMALAASGHAVLGAINTESQGMRWLFGRPSCGVAVTLQGRWWQRNAQRNCYAGATITHMVRRVRFDGGWNFIHAEGSDNYAYARAAALAYPDTAPNAGPGNGEFPTTTYQMNEFTVGVTVPLTERISLRLFDYFQIGRVSDWHYAGFGTSLAYDHRVYVDGGPTNFSANVVGVLFNIRL